MTSSSVPLRGPIPSRSESLSLLALLPIHTAASVVRRQFPEFSSAGINRRKLHPTTAACGSTDTTSRCSPSRSQFQHRQFRSTFFAVLRHAPLLHGRAHCCPYRFVEDR